HFEPVSRKRIPLQHWSKLDYLDVEIAGDKKIIWELNRHQYFQTLGQAYWLTGNERTARVFTAHLEACMDANPPKLGVNWASRRFSFDLVALGFSFLQIIAVVLTGSLQPRAEVFVSQRATSRVVLVDLFQPEHAPDGRSARTFLHRHDAA